MSILAEAVNPGVPVIVAQTETLRLVHTLRNQKTWPAYSDLVLERLDKNAMGEPIWLQVDSWMLSPRKFSAILDGRKQDSVITALNMLLTEFHPVEKE